ncbi:MAG: Cupin domain protein [Candidatus Angelobacter sp.]|nr:Cupin domain protein [Candidatus Angelobacter sp.]
MRNLSIATLFFLLALTAWTQQAQAPVEITSEPSHHLVLENMFVRVFAVSVDPGKSSLMHHHGHDYLSVSLGDAQIMNTKQGAQPVPASFKDGDVRFTPAGLVHAVANSGTTPFRNRTIELMQPTTNAKACAESCSIPIPCDSADKATCATVAKLFTADQWSATMVTLPPGAKYPQHTHLANFLNIPLTDAEVTIKNQDQPETVVHSKAGEQTWNNPAVHTVTNSGKSTAKVVVLEFRGRPAGEGSESMAPQSKDAPKPHDHQ